MMQSIPVQNCRYLSYQYFANVALDYKLISAYTSIITANFAPNCPSLTIVIYVMPPFGFQCKLKC